MSQNELILPTEAVHERLGIQQPKVIPATEAVNIRKLVVEDPESGVQSTFLSASDLIVLLDREYEATEAPEIRQLRRVVRHIAGST